MAVPTSPLPPVGPTPLVGSLAWEGVVEEEFQAGRGVVVDEAFFHPPPQCQATKFLPGVPPYLPIFKFILACCSFRWDTNRLPAPPPVPVGVCVGG